MKSIRVRVRTPDDLISYDVFVITDRQPSTLRPGCVLLVNESDGSLLVAHKTRLIAVESSGRESSGRAFPASKPRSVCLSCGKVQGVVEDEIVCAHQHDSSCGLIQPSLPDKPRPPV